MKAEKNILIAFVLNFAFSIFEFVGGAITGSVAIISDAIHDLGDALSIGISCVLERKSKKQPDSVYTYGYARYSVIGGFITTIVLAVGSALVIYNAIIRIFNPTPIDYSKMIVFAIVGVVVNFVAAYFTKEGDSLNQKAVNLHMLEDVLGWVVVLLGAIVMRFTDFSIIDPVMSICVALFIFVNAVKNLKQIGNLFLEKIPADIDIDDIKKHILAIDGVEGVHHIHIWSMDGHHNYATMHIVTEKEHTLVKKEIRDELKHHHINHVTLELENCGEDCQDEHCHTDFHGGHQHHHHH